MKVAPGRIRLYVSLSLAVVLVLSATVPAGALFLSPAEKCRLAKLKTAGKYHFCRIKAIGKGLKFDAAPDFSRCDKKFASKWEVFEERALAKGIPCPTEDDAATMQLRLSNDAARVDQALSSLRFVDKGDGTTTDVVTGLMWERKAGGAGCPGLHCVDDVSNWGALTEWLSAVNGHTDDPSAQGGLGGHSDWRIPSIVELQTILIQPFPCPASPCIFTALGPFPVSAPFRYWSSTTSAVTPTAAWFLDFADARPYVGGKLGAGVHFRAVRGGL